MSVFTITIDGHPVQVQPGQTVLDAARALGVDIPTLCYLEKCGPLNSCLVCLVKIRGKLVPSCGTRVEPDMVVESETNEVYEARRTALELLLSDHVGDCLSPCHRLCPLRMNIPLMLRQVQTGELKSAVATVRNALPLASVLGRLCHHPCEQGCRRASLDDAAGIRDVERFVAEWDLGLSGAEQSTPALGYLPEKKSPSGKSVAIIGSGPAGLAAAHLLLRQGHACTVFDRQQRAGGTLRSVDPSLLPPKFLHAEVEQLARLGARFQFGAILGKDLTLASLLREFDSVLVTVGEITKVEGDALGLEMVPGGIKARPDSYETSLARVFAAGRATRPFDHLVRAMSDGQAAAECVDLFLRGKKIVRSAKPFSSVMGKLEKAELGVFLESASKDASVAPCDACAGFNRAEATAEAGRCLHCDCRSAGDCALQQYAEAYGADAGRFRQQRRPFEQYMQPGGILFEPGKCILCGICVKLTELAREPLGLTFIGRGFNVRLAAPFNHTIAEGLQKVAEECVRNCPTGALVFRCTASVKVEGGACRLETCATTELPPPTEGTRSAED